MAIKSRFGGAVTESDTFVDVADDVVEYEEREITFTKMAEALVMLGEPCKTLLEDFYLQDLSMQAITEKFGYTNADNAKNQKYKCLLRLKKLFFSLYKTEVERGWRGNKQHRVYFYGWAT